MNLEKVSIVHLKSLKGKTLKPNSIKKRNQKFDRVATVAWNFNKESGILRYAGTVFKKESKDEQWNKREHTETAIKRYNSIPINIRIVPEKSLKNKNIDVDEIYYLIDKFVCMYGAYFKDEHKTLYNKIYQYGTNIPKGDVKIDENYPIINYRIEPMNLVKLERQLSRQQNTNDNNFLKIYTSNNSKDITIHIDYENLKNMTQGHIVEYFLFIIISLPLFSIIFLTLVVIAISYGR